MAMNQVHAALSESVAHAIATAHETSHIPVTFDNCEHIVGPFFHGTKTRIEVGDYLIAGQPSNYQQGRISNHVYFASLLEPAVWAAELASEFTGTDGPGHIYIVQPSGPFEDDPNVTNKKFPGNVTQSYRTRHPMLVVDEVKEWEAHPTETLQTMLNNLARLREKGLDVIED